MENERKEILETIGKNVKSIRLSRGITQEVMAEKLNKSTNFVSLLEKGSSGASLQTLVDICNILQVDANSIFKGLLTYNIEEKDRYIIDNISAFSGKDKKIMADLINYIIGNANRQHSHFLLGMPLLLALLRKLYP